MSEFEIITAVLAGSRHLEMRIFANCHVSPTVEQAMTQHLCILMDRKEKQWRR